tara:strand:- start:641 stop:1231 length:591 start_codon:yes stop_codon:yes gene_type:complete
MTSIIEFYYDFVSPYSYLAHKRIVEIKKSKKIEFLYKPILLGGLHNLLKITPAAFTKSKDKYMVEDCKMVANKYKIDFIFNNKFPINSLILMRGVLTLKEDEKDNFIKNFFDAYWGLNIDLSKEDEVNKILGKLNINSEEFSKKIKDQKIKDKLKNLTQEAYNKEIFGAPTFVVNNKLFWGQDRLDFAIDEYEKIK